LHLVKLLTEQIDGRLEFSSNGGTEFKIVFSEPQPRPAKENIPSRERASEMEQGEHSYEQRTEQLAGKGLA
jgi:hypothetical protein